MILSEDQAKTKRCQESFGDGNVTPTGHMVSVHAGGGAYYAMGTSPSMCLGSGCMAWRWHDGEPEPGETSCRGYCGKAGRPSP